MEPVIAEIPTPNIPEFSPMILDIVSALRKLRSIPTDMITPRNCGIIFSKDFTAVLIARKVFFLSFTKDAISNKQAAV